MVLNRITCKCLLIDIACPFDTRVNEKEQNKIKIYGDLRDEYRNGIWNMEKEYGNQRSGDCTSDSRSVGYHLKKFEKWVEKLEINVQIPLLQKACLVGTGKVLRKVLDTLKK